MEENVNMKYLGEQFGHMNATILMELKNDLCSMSLEEIKKEVKSHNYPIKDIKKLTKEALISEIIIWNADNDIPVEADELEAVLNDDVNFLNQEEQTNEGEE